MTKQQKLKKIIEFAVERGWKDYILTGKVTTFLDEPKYIGFAPIRIESESGAVNLKRVEQLLFDHDFAKAVFGEERIYTLETSVIAQTMPSWAFHLQQAVISKDPIDYYYKYVKRERK